MSTCSTPSSHIRLAAALYKMGHKPTEKFEDSLTFNVGEMEFMLYASPDTNNYGYEEAYSLHLDCGDFDIPKEYKEPLCAYVNHLQNFRLSGVAICVDEIFDMHIDIQTCHFSFQRENPYHIQKTLETMIDMMLQARFHLEGYIQEFKEKHGLIDEAETGDKIIVEPSEDKPQKTSRTKKKSIK